MSDILISAAFVAFVLFLILGKYRKYAAISGWVCIVLNLLSEIPALVAEANFLYPILALLSFPFIAITVRELLDESIIAIRLSTTAAVATIIFVPFAVVPFLRDALIGIVINTVFLIVTALGHHPSWGSWDIIFENGFFNQIIFTCSGLLAIAMVLGVIAGIPGPDTWRRIGVAILVVPVLFILNIFRVAGIFIAVSDQWFSGFPDPTGTGDANFFWAHNVIAEGLSLIFLILLLVVLSRVLPELWVYVKGVGNMYIGGIRRFAHGE